MAIPPSFLDELKSRLTLSELVGRRVKLRKAGREHTGLCPFHHEKTPSFTVNDAKGFYHCFGCGAHGDHVAFLMAHERLSFTEAVQQLADQAGLELPRAARESHQDHDRNRLLLSCLEAASAIFQDALRRPIGSAARDYLQRRGLDQATIDQFGLGYAPANGQDFQQAMTSRGFEPSILIEAGLLRQPDDGRAPFTFFRDRLVFPVEDRRGRVVGFGARSLGDGNGPKYLNSPDTPLFHKGQLLYGLPRAREAVGQGHHVVVAEGYMDVIALVRAGFRGAVAPLGTAVTEDQIRELWKLSAQPVLCFDGDTAGQRAAWRVADRALPLLKPDHTVRIAFLPSGEDPDSLLATQGEAPMRDILQGARGLADVLWERQILNHRLGTPEGRAGLKAALDNQAQSIADPTVRRFYLQYFRDRIGEEFMRRQDRPDRGGGQRARGGSGPRSGSGDNGGISRQSSLGPSRGGPKLRQPLPYALVAMVLHHPDVFDECGELLGLVQVDDPDVAELRDALIDVLSRETGLDSQGLESHLDESCRKRGCRRLDALGVYSLMPFVCPGTPLSAVREGWAEVWKLHGREQLNRELRKAADAWSSEQSDSNLARLRALQALVMSLQSA